MKITHTPKTKKSESKTPLDWRDSSNATASVQYPFRTETLLKDQFGSECIKQNKKQTAQTHHILNHSSLPINTLPTRSSRRRVWNRDGEKEVCCCMAMWTTERCASGLSGNERTRELNEMATITITHTSKAIVCCCPTLGAGYYNGMRMNICVCFKWLESNTHTHTVRAQRM